MPFPQYLQAQSQAYCFVCEVYVRAKYIMNTTIETKSWRIWWFT